MRFHCPVTGTCAGSRSAQPGRVEGRVLLKAGLLGKEETRSSVWDFFKGGRGRRRQRAWAVASARARRRRDIEPRSNCGQQLPHVAQDGTRRRPRPRLPDQSSVRSRLPSRVHRPRGRFQ